MRSTGTRNPPAGAAGLDGREYRADDPHLLEVGPHRQVDSFLVAYQLYGAAPLGQDGRDDYVADTARVASALGVPDPPRTEAELGPTRGVPQWTAQFRGRPDAARFLLVTPRCHCWLAPLRSGGRDSVSMLPWWARLPLRLPYLPPVEATAIRLSGRVLVSEYAGRCRLTNQNHWRPSNSGVRRRRVGPQ